MQIQTIQNQIFYQNRINKTITNPISKQEYKQITDMPNTFYYPLSFGKDTNKEIIEKLAQTEDLAKRMELFGQLSPNIQDNLRNTAEKLKSSGLTFEKYLPACIKQPSLFYRLPESIEKNVKGAVEKFKNNGLTLKDYLSVCIKQPSLFTLSPETIEKNVKEIVEKFKNNGLTPDAYISACLKQASLFNQSPETIEKNIKEVVERFKNNGLTLEAYLHAATKHPPLFCQSPDTIAKHITELVEKFKNHGLTVNEYLSACLKKPPLFSYLPETVAEHINAYRYIFQSNPLKSDVHNIVAHRNLLLSTAYIYIKDLVLPQLKANDIVLRRIGNLKTPEKLVKYLNMNLDKVFTIIIPQGTMAQHCQETVKEFFGKKLIKPERITLIMGKI